MRGLRVRMRSAIAMGLVSLTSMCGGGEPTVPGVARTPPLLASMEADPVVVWRGGGALHLTADVWGADADLVAIHLHFEMAFANPPPSRSRQRLLLEGESVGWVPFTRVPDGGGPAIITRFVSPALRPHEERTTPLATWFPIIATAARFVFPETTIDVTLPADQRVRVSIYSADQAVIPIPTVVDLAPDARRTDHVISLAMPMSSTAVGVRSDVDIARRFLDRVGHEPDFLMVYPLDRFVAAGFLGTYRMYRNDMTGLGLDIHEVADAPGHQRLRGAAVSVTGPDPVWNRLMIHEILHQWAAHIDPAFGLTSSSHWTANLDRQFTGFSSGAYNDLELYLMGLIPADSVQPAQISHDGLTIEDVIERHGPRSPAWPQTQRSFSAAVVLPYHRLLTADELAVFEFLAAEFGAEEAHPARNALGPITFFEATGGRATLTTRIPDQP